ncbi:MULTISPECIES: FkbM family methyltransferase [unclassified Streptomyces]|uniref:FkbM family methyltransferase n=1 Tax=unclassified Streptomyces TaxID=2593676 RepID=UPI00214C8744|nr:MULTISPECIES: FkbM family methyltransferase [unclassified Streptomyces]MCX5609965.1 FkbM family methyltransferase [Streptomyces sp. NBC_00047]UUU43847.1 FkbM family methyltransferase [Streptomyces sp. NBC_00162]
MTVTASARAASPLLDLVRPARPTHVVDVGANPIDGDPPYRDMLAAGLCRVTGFEPQPDALDELKRRKGPHETYLPDALGDGGTHTLHVAATSGMTSLFRPDTNRLGLFNGFSEWGRVREEVQISTRRLDDVEEVDAFDLLKIDIQGAELMVFEGGRRKLAEAVAVHTEVSFVPLYENQPVFGDVDQELRGQGFIPHAFAAVKRWPIAPVVFGGDFRQARHQLLEADVVYVRDFGHPESMTDEQLKQLALVAHHVYDSTDLAYHCLSQLSVRGLAVPDAPNRFLAALGSANRT